jgi:YHS domain-containing protein
MNRQTIMIIAAAQLVLCATAYSFAQDTGKFPATQPATGPSAEMKDELAVLCPVTGQPVDRAMATRFHNRWVYCANKDALQKFQADPLEYADNLQAQWEVDKPIRVQVKCPVTGKPPGEFYVGLGEGAIFFASAEAKQRWLEGPTQFEKKLADCYTYQTGCGLCGMLINPVISREVDGETVFFCCDGCAGGFVKEKEANLKHVRQQAEANMLRWIGKLTEKLRAIEAAATQPAPAQKPQK